MANIIEFNEFKARVLTKIAQYEEYPWWFYFEPSNSLTRILVEGATLGYQPAMDFVGQYFEAAPLLSHYDSYPQGQLTISDILAS
jgi:hypothetical protein